MSKTMLNKHKNQKNKLLHATCFFALGLFALIALPHLAHSETIRFVHTNDTLGHLRSQG